MISTEPALAHRIVVGVDGSPSSVAAVEWAVNQAHITSSTVEALTTWEWPTTYGFPLMLPDGYDPSADARRILDDTLEPVRAAHPTVHIQPIVKEGHPGPALVEASRGADLLVVGTRGHAEFTGMLIGSVSAHCVAHSLCPVLVLRGRG